MVNANRTTKWAGAKLKQETDILIEWQIKTAMNAGTCRRPAGSVAVSFEWHERTRRRDLDNIYSGKKFILDAMQKIGLLEGDGQKFVHGLQDTFVLDKEDKVVVTLHERDETD